MDRGRPEEAGPGEDEQQRYRDLFEFAPDGYLVTDLLGNIREANRAAAALFDIPVAEMIGLPVAHFVEEAGRAVFSEVLAESARQGFVRQWQVKMCTRARGSFVADIHVAHAHNSAGTPSALRWLVRDVTEHSRAAEKIKMREQQLAEAQQIAHVGSWHWDIANNVITWSDELYRIYGVTPSERALTFADYIKLVHPDDRERVDQIVTGAYLNPGAFTFDHRIVRPDGSIRILHARGEVISDAQGNPLHMLGTGQDVTESRAAEERIRQLNEQLEDRVAERTAQLEAINQELRREISERQQAEQALRENEAQFRQVAESIDHVFWLRDETDTPPLYVSPAFEKVFGLPRESMHHDLQSFYDIIHPEDRERVQQVLSGPLNGNYSEEYRIVRPDGALRWIWTRTFPAQERDDAPIRFVGLSQDITDRKQTENALRAALERTRELYQISRLIALVRTPADVLHALTLSNFIRRVNRAAIFLFEKPWQDNPPDTCRVLASWRSSHSLTSIEGQIFPLLEYGLNELFVLDQPMHIQDVRTDPRVNENMRTLFGRLHTCSVTMFPLVASGQWYGMLSLHSDSPGHVSEEDMLHMRGLADQAAVAIHNIRLLEAEAQARREAERANDLKLKFLAMISHELRTPLTSIKGFATTLLASDVTWDADTQREFIVTINQEADKLTDMIEQLLDLSRMQAGTLRIKPEVLAFDDILLTALAQLQTLTQHHQLVTQVSGELPPVYADRQRVAQVLTNLVDNAVKYSPAQSTITISARLTDNNVEIGVQDEGAGIPPEDRQIVFEAFRRGEGESTHRTKGAGLGLAICKHLIEAHSGKIWLQDHASPGTLIMFTLPVATARPGQPRTLAARESSAGIIG
ncbi:MAG: PAS domain-containing protein [Chloroflexi bacterium]|nr:PAS domain-containing protein [Chloroflexota bacterium]